MARQQWSVGAGVLLGLLVLAVASATIDEAAARRAVADVPDDREIARLVRQLGSDKFKERQEASRRLKEIGAPALDALYQAMSSSDTELRHRAEAILAVIEEPVKAIEKLGGKVTRDAERRGKGVV